MFFWVIYLFNTIYQTINYIFLFSILPEYSVLLLLLRTYYNVRPAGSVFHPNGDDAPINGRDWPAWRRSRNLHLEGGCLCHPPDSAFIFISRCLLFGAVESVVIVSKYLAVSFVWNFCFELDPVVCYESSWCRHQPRFHRAIPQQHRLNHLGSWAVELLKI